MFAAVVLCFRCFVVSTLLQLLAVELPLELTMVVMKRKMMTDSDLKMGIGFVDEVAIENRQNHS